MPLPPFKISCYATSSAVRDYALQQLQIIRLASFLVGLCMRHTYYSAALALLKISFCLTVLKKNVDDT